MYCIMQLVLREFFLIHVSVINNTTINKRMCSVYDHFGDHVCYSYKAHLQTI